MYRSRREAHAFRVSGEESWLRLRVEGRGKLGVASVVGIAHFNEFLAGVNL